MRIQKLSLLLMLSIFVLPLNLWAQSECNVTLAPGDDVAATVESATPTQVICLEAGTYPTNFTISESLTLRGATDGDTILSGATAGRSVVRMARTGDTLDVVLENLIIRDAFPIKGEEDCFNQGICPDGISILGDFNVSLINVQVLDNHDDGIQIFGAQLLADNVISQGNGDSGLITQGFGDFGAADITITRSQFSGNSGDGLLLIGPTQFLMEDSQVNENQGTGINAIGNPGPTMTVRRSDVIGNGFEGIQLISIGDEAVFESLRIEGNGVHFECNEQGVFCNGITLNGGGDVSLINSSVSGNAGWGIFAVLIQCGAEEDDYEVNLTLENNVIENNMLGASCLP